jgi:hypothetical protein
VEIVHRNSQSKIILAADPLAGLAVKLEHDRCKCVSDTVIISAGNP